MENMVSNGDVPSFEDLDDGVIANDGAAQSRLMLNTDLDREAMRETSENQSNSNSNQEAERASSCPKDSI